MADHEDPLVGFHFAVEIQNVVSGYFTECSGLGSEHEIIEHKVVTESGQEVVMKIPGRLKWENITLKRGITSSMDIWEWRKQVEDGRVEESRHDGSITMFDHELTPVARWEFKRAWPVKVTGPQPKADSNEIGIEELTLAHEYISRVSI
jgi:phage tail-like protein